MGLDADEFRLFHLELRSPDNELKWGKIPVGTVQNFKLDEAPPYRAISYVCGDPYTHESWDKQPISLDPGAGEARPPKLDAEIICDGKRFLVYGNLYNALEQFVELGIHGWVWVDVICINQDDAAERAKQVLLMGKIYSVAGEVLVWLGHEISETRDALLVVTDVISAIHQAVERGTVELETLAASIPFDPDMLMDSAIEDLPDKLLAFGRFCKMCRWFDRMRIIQEFALAKHCRMFCGAAETQWSSWDKIISFLFRYSVTQVISALMEIQTPGNGWHWIDAVLRLYRVGGVSKYLLSVQFLHMPPALNAREGSEAWHSARFFIYAYRFLQFCCCASCSDGRDKLHSIFGIVEKCLGYSIAPYVQPDYENDVGKVYTNFATKVLQETQSADLLAYAGQSLIPTTPGLPSWVPDWRTRSLRDAVVWPYMIQNLRLEATSGLFLPSQLDISDGLLRCSGVQFDTVREVHSTIVKMFDSPIPALEFALKIPPYISRRRRLEVLWRTCILDVTGQHGTPAPGWHEKGFLGTLAFSSLAQPIIADELDENKSKNDLDKILELLRAFEKSTDEDCIFDEQQAKDHLDRVLSLRSSGVAPPDMAALSRELDQATHLYVSAMSVAIGRSLFLTQQRSLLGLGVDGMREGDQIWLLADAGAPFILRPTETKDHFRLIGDCFILDHMNGEIARGEPELKDKVQIIKIV